MPYTSPSLASWQHLKFHPCSQLWLGAGAGDHSCNNFNSCATNGMLHYYLKCQCFKLWTPDFVCVVCLPHSLLLRLGSLVQSH